MQIVSGAGAIKFWKLYFSNQVGNYIQIYILSEFYDTDTPIYYLKSYHQKLQALPSSTIGYSVN